MSDAGIEAVSIVEDLVLIANFKRIAALSVSRRFPSISFVEYPEAGGLFGYGADFLALYRRAAVFVDKILRGARPGEISIERPATFQFVINMKTARALDIGISAATRLRARLIE